MTNKIVNSYFLLYLTYSEYFLKYKQLMILFLLFYSTNTNNYYNNINYKINSIDKNLLNFILRKDFKHVKTLKLHWSRRIGLSSSSRVIDLHRIEFLITRLKSRVESSSEVKIENQVKLKSRDREIESENPIRPEISVLAY